MNWCLPSGEGKGLGDMRVTADWIGFLLGVMKKFCNFRYWCMHAVSSVVSDSL